jgi:Zn finger protein HypA/HybF involved in hydrogenase expression
LIAVVHIYCPCEGCRKVIHLDNLGYWNFEGKIRCPHCGSGLELEVKDGEVAYLKRLHTDP